MSRCFPFPPPGYEKKFKIDDANLLGKGKHKKEKKRKLERDKDNEKKEGEEKKDRERSKRRNRDKERKEKHADETGDKNRHKSRKINEKRLEGQSKSCNPENSLGTCRFEETSFVQELGKRISNEHAATSQSVEKLTSTHQNRAEFLGKAVLSKKENETSKDKNGDDNEAKAPKVENLQNFGGTKQRIGVVVRPIEKDINNPLDGKEKEKRRGSEQKGDKHKDNHGKRFGKLKLSNGQIFNSNGVQTVQLNETMFVQELQKRVGDEDGARSEITKTIIGSSHRRDKSSLGRVLDRNAADGSEGKESYNYGGGFDSKANGQRAFNGARGPEDRIVQNLKGTEQRRAEINRSFEKDFEGPVEGKPMGILDGSAFYENKVEEGKRKSKVQDQNKKQKAEKAVAEDGECNKELSRLKKIGNGPINGFRPHLFKECYETSAGSANAAKRKEPETNGFLHDADIQCSKLPKLVSFDHPVTENGRKYEAGAVMIHSTSTAKNDHKINGIIEAQRTDASTSLPFSYVKTEKIQSLSHKQPHPDAKFLSQLLSVPKMEKWPEYDGQDWLFGSKKTEVGCFHADGEQQVQSHALYLESADVFALPYVLPY
ncbi:hypothetical protein Nepgr_022240 [Nepenthes gracilis]|uniref:Uncharacterized protein n=1 Tax=Nepenthes gracilis TaxID=150966 RepID=A0AAD3XXV6_NEPGR|nr:hypothetical protein Nepgr_022240 [Nepenthes gracilis]